MTHPVSRYQDVRPLLWLVSLAIFMQMLDTTIVTTALPALAISLHQSPLQMQSVVVSYSLSVAIFIPASGWLADRYGTRRTFFCAMIIFSLASGLCAVANRLDALVFARVIQGIGGAMLLPIGRLALLKSIAQEDYLRAMSFIAIPALIGPLVGPALGGWLTEAASWRWVFLVNLPAGIIGCVACLIIMPDHYADSKRPFDVKGYLQLALAMVALSLAVDGLDSVHTQTIIVALLALGGIVCLWGYWRHAHRVASPLFPLNLFYIPSFRVGLLGNLFARIGSSSIPILLPLLLQLGLGLTPTRTGALLTPLALAGMVSKRCAVPLVHTFGYRHVLVVNTILIGLSIASFALSDLLSLHLLIGLMTSFGALNSLQFTVMNTLTLHKLPPSVTTAGNSVMSLVMMLSTSFGAATAGALLHAFSNRSNQTSAKHALSATFVCLCLITLFTSLIFLRLEQPTKTLNKADD